MLNGVAFFEICFAFMVLQTLLFGFRRPGSIMLPVKVWFLPSACLVQSIKCLQFWHMSRPSQQKASLCLASSWHVSSMSPAYPKQI